MLREVSCHWWMPIAALVDGRAAFEKLIDQFVERLDNFIAARNGECTAWAEVVLYIDYQESLIGLSHTLTG